MKKINAPFDLCVPRSGLEKRWALLLMCLITACADIPSLGSKGPSIGGDPARMSADTLCYRGAYARSSEAIQNEIAARNLDCRAILAQQPVFQSENGL